MPDTKITGLAAASALTSTCLFVVVDTAITTMAPTGTDLKLTTAQLQAGITIAESQVTGLTSDLATLTTAVAARLVAASNLSDLTNTATARTNIGLGNVTNDAQTKAAIVPNTAPSAGQILAGNAGGTAYAPVTVSGSGATITLSSAGVITVSAIPNGSLSNSSLTVTAGTGLSGGGSVSLGGSTTVSLSTPVSVPNGGTGASSLTSSAVLLGNGSSAISAASNILKGANNQLSLTEISTPGTQVSGDLWTDSTQHCLAGFDGSATSANCLTNYRVAAIYIQNADVTVTGTGATTLLSSTSDSGTVSLPTAYLSVLNRCLRITARGYATTAVSSPGNLNFTIKLGSSIIASTLSQALTANRTVQVNWLLDVLVTVKTAGAGGKLDTMGVLLSPGGAALFAQNFQIQNSTNGTTLTPTSQVSIDLTAALAVDIQSNFTATGNSITCTNVVMEVIG